MSTMENEPWTNKLKLAYAQINNRAEKRAARIDAKLKDTFTKLKIGEEVLILANCLSDALNKKIS